MLTAQHRPRANGIRTKPFMLSLSKHDSIIRLSKSDRRGFLTPHEDLMTPSYHPRE
jgi:hypothetical protein